MNTFQPHFQLQTSKVSIKTLEPSIISGSIENLIEQWKHSHTSCSYYISRNTSPCWVKTRSWLVKRKLGKLRLMVTGFHPVSIFTLSLRSFCISVNSFSARCYRSVLLACGEVMRWSLGQPSAHLLTQFVWHYCPSLDTMGLWQTRVYDVQTCTLNRVMALHLLE